jgi:pyruvate dehydrogenase E1 component
MQHKDQPTLILAKTVKGFGMGRAAGEGQNVTHQQKKLTTVRCASSAIDSISGVGRRDRARAVLPADREQRRTAVPAGTPQGARRYLPLRRTNAPPLQVPGLDAFAPLLEASGDREISTTMAFVRLLASC